MFMAFESAERLFLRGSFWVVSTDYVNYALIYGCNQQKDDGHCHRHHQLVYLLSRTPDLSPRIMSQAERIIEDTLCVDMNQLVLSVHQVNCMPDENSVQQDDPNVVVDEPVQEEDKTDEVTNDIVECADLDCDVETLGCEHGLKKDDAGCDTCACHICNPVMCLMLCEHGFVKDERNCSICSCQQALELVQTEIIDNAIGTDDKEQVTEKKDKEDVDETESSEDKEQNEVIQENDGGDQEQADENVVGDIEIQENVGGVSECSPIMCPMACEHGFEEDENGCRTCRCHQCAIPMCKNRCEHGYQLSDKGCETCGCKPAPAVANDLVACPALNCHVECGSGYKKDENGCDICRCNGCPDIRCLMYCANGYKQDDKGCQFCECRNDGNEDKIIEDKCKVEDIQAVADLDMDKIVGEWRTLAAATTLGAVNKFVVRLEKEENGIRTLFRSVWSDSCGPTLRGSWTPTTDGQAGDFYAQYGYNTGPMKIIHVTDSYEYLLTYHCFHTRPDGTCAKQIIDILGKNNEFPDEVKMELLSKIPSTCAGPDDFVQLSPSDRCGIRRTGEAVESCKLADLQPQKHVRWSGFEGRWYSVAKLYSRDVDQSGEYLIKPALDGRRISLKYRGSRDGICRDVSEALIAPVDNGSGAFTIYFGKVRAQGMLIYTDNRVALYYECGEETETGECKAGSEYVEVMYRENHAPGYLQMVYGRLLEDFCVSADDLVTVDHKVECPVTEACKISDIPSQADFNATAFSGKWHSVARLRRTQGWDHVVAHIVAIPDNRLVLHYTGTKNKHCQSPSIALLNPISVDNPADFMLQSGRRSAHVKVVYTNYHVAVVYECQTEGHDGKCLGNQEYLDVLSKDLEEFTQDDLHELKSHLNAACVQEDEMKITPQRVDCNLEDDSNQCVMADLPRQKYFTPDMATGKWYVVMSDFNSVQYIKPSMREVTLLPDGHLLHSIVSVRNGECTDRRTLIMKAINDDWSLARYHLIKGKFTKPELSVAHADNETMITYSCNEVDESGACVPGQMFVFVSSKEPAISEEKKESLFPILEQLCVDPNTLVTYDNSVECEIEMKDPSLGSCTVNKTPILKKFDIKQAMGKWYVTSRTKGSNSPDSLVLELTPGQGDFVNAKYTGFRQGYCMEERHFQLEQQHEPEEAQLFITYADKLRGIVRVVFTDYSHMMLYECGLMTSDGSCAGGQASVEILSRVAEQPESTLQYAMSKRLAELCIAETDIEPVPHNVSCENFKNDCDTRPVPSQDNFNVTAFLGTWHSVARLKTSTPWESGAVNFTMKPDGNIEVIHVSARQGHCVQSQPSLLEPVNGGKASEWVFSNHHAISVKVVFTDYDNIAIIHECDAQNEDGTCPLAHRHVDVLSRDPEGPVEGTKKKLGHIGLQLCVRRRDFRETPKPVLCGFTRAEKRQCDAEELPLQEDLNPYTLLGEWFSYARMKGSLAIESSKYLITRGDSYGSKLKMFYAGTRKGQCIIGGQSNMEARTDEPSKFTLSYVENGEMNTGELTVLYADDNNALVHECYHVKPDGSCEISDTYVEILSRNKKLSPDARPHIIDALYKACFTLEDLKLSRQEVNCEIPIPGRQCLYDDIKQHPEFDYRTIMGKTWFTRARLVPGNEPIWSGTGHFEFSHLSTNVMQTAWASAEVGKNGESQCFMGIDQMERLSSDAGFVGTYDESIVHTKVLFADNDLLIFFDCKKNGSHCLDDGKEIDINQRDRTTPLTPAAINFVKDVIRTQTCENPDDLEILPVSIQCPSPAGTDLGRLCYQDTIEAQKDLDLSKISGLWFQVARSDSADDIHWDAGVFHLSNLSPETVRIEFTGRSRYNEDTCLPVYTVDAYPDDKQPANMAYASTRLEEENGLMKIIHADDEMLVIYECLPGGKQVNGLCKRNKEHVEVYARRTRLSSRNFEKVNQVLHDRTCFSEQDLIMSNRSTTCHLPNHDHIRHSAPSCKVLDYPSVRMVDYKQFSGLWYEIERTQYHDTAVQWSSTSGNNGKLWEAAVLHYDAIKADVFNYTYAGYTLRDGLCQGPFVAHTHPAPGEEAKSGHLHLFPGHTEAHGGPWLMHGVHKIVWTDYEEAVVYICFHENDDGTCRKNREFVSIISRNTEVEESKLQEIHQIVKQSLCVDLTEFVQPHRDYAKCLGSIGIEYTIKEGSGEGDEDIHVCRKAMCRMACEFGFKKDEHGCPICRCNEHAADDDGSGSGSGAEHVKAELGSGADEAFQAESSGEAPKQLSKEEKELLREIESLNLIGH